MAQKAPEHSVLPDTMDAFFNTLEQLDTHNGKTITIDLW
jgi:hypothetical protein